MLIYIWLLFFRTYLLKYIIILKHNNVIFYHAFLCQYEQNSIKYEVVNKSIEVHRLNVNKIQKCFKVIKKQKCNHQSKYLF